VGTGDGVPEGVGEGCGVSDGLGGGGVGSGVAVGVPQAERKTAEVAIRNRYLFISSFLQRSQVGSSSHVGRKCILVQTRISCRARRWIQELNAERQN
jgi:hypothetical protein